jgi:uncharacterized protein DUF4038/collagenase-like protein with putative collagen-binding domain
MRRLLGIALALWGCHRPLQPHPAQAVIAVTARLAPAAGGARQVVATAGGASVTLTRDNGGDFRGLLAVTPGQRDLRVSAVPAGAPAGSIDIPLAVARTSPAQVFVTLGVEQAPSAGPSIRWVASPQSSVVVGDRVALEARGDAPGASPAEIAWSNAPAGCGSFGDALSARTSWTAARAGTCTLSVTATAAGKRDARTFAIAVRTRGSDYRFPLRSAPGGRHLEDQRGTPFLVKGETAWLALVNLDAREQEAYLADRGARGFNLIEVMLVNHDYTSPPNPVPPANRAGEQPFLRPGDFSTPNDAYFDRAAAFVRRAGEHGMAVLLAPLYLGFDGGREGWWQELSAEANTRQVCFSYGKYLGSRFRQSENLLWVAGGDFAPPAGSEAEARALEVLRGIRAAGAAQPWTGHWNFDHQGGISTDEALFASAMDINGIYQDAQPWRFAARAYAVTPPRPSFLLESAYEREHPRSRLQPFRKAWWWSMLSGAAGVFWSNYFLWMCEAARGTYPAAYGDGDGTVSSWSAELDSPGTDEVLHLHAFFEAIAWERLVPSGIPSGGPELLTSGKGSRDGRIAAAATAEGDLLVAYVPPDGTGQRAFSLDLSRMRRPARARWFDPASGAFSPAEPPLPAGGSAELRTPGANGSGVNDWVLLVESQP